MQTPAHPPPRDAGPATAELGPPCESASDCPPDARCVRAPGCEPAGAGHCAAGAQCSDDYATFCDCDGVSFHASATCPERGYARQGECSLGEATTEAAVETSSGDATCDDATDCTRGRTCMGIEGCTTIWTCARGVRCSRDTQAFCGCDGQTFRASMTCPGRPFRRRGPCDDGTGSVSPASALDAGARATDVGVRTMDAGVRAWDAGVRATDAGVRATDAGVRATDAGVRAVDAGARAVDAGVRAMDAGVAPAPAPALGAGECRTARDCARGEACEGDEGCGTVWRCVPAHPCTRDTQYFCGCDGRTFRASMQCPGRPYAHRGSCPR